ncbi:MAG: hypothetical protein ACXVBU_02705, partial [Ktedonobacteraceae bacterium]
DYRVSGLTGSFVYSRDIPLRVSSGPGRVLSLAGFQYFSHSPAESKGPPPVYPTALAPTILHRV